MDSEAAVKIEHHRDLREHREIFVIGASAGALPALTAILSELPADFPGAVFIVVHISPGVESRIAQILDSTTPLRVTAPADQTAIERGQAYVSTPDCHMLIEPGRIRVVRGPKENRHRPAIDPLFRSAAWTYGPRVVGIVLTGYLDDGAAGLWAIKTCGGVTVVQDPDDAPYPDMPRNAIRQSKVDHCLPAREIAALMQRLAQERVDPARIPAPPPAMKAEVDIATSARPMHIPDMATLGRLSPFTCPSCHGALWELQEGNLLRYRCHTGHAFSGESLVSEQSTAVEEAVYSAMRIMEEKSSALRRLKDNWHERFPVLAAEYEVRASELDDSVQVLRRLLARGEV